VDDVANKLTDEEIILALEKLTEVCEVNSLKLKVINRHEFEFDLEYGSLIKKKKKSDHNLKEDE
jgi:hypothetical protein